MLSVLGVLMLWQVTVTAFGNPVFVPTPVMVLGKGAVLLRSGEIFGHVGVSLGRILGGFALGSVLGAPIGLLMGNVRLVRVLLEPYVEFFRFVPSIAWLTPAVIWFGIGETPKVLIIMYTTVFIVIINTVVGVANVSSNKLWAARCLGATERQAFVYVVVPATLPFVLTGMRLAMGNSFATVVSAEMIAADQGMGFLIFNSRLWMATDTIFLTIVLLGALGFASDRCFRMLIRRFARQFGPAE
jgi:NitT/TauT family transport system permease protein